jgi:transposase
MARFREYCYEQTVMLPVALSRNDETGAPAIDPAILLKIALFAYSRGIL